MNLELDQPSSVVRLPAEKKSKPNPDVETLFCQDLEPVDEDDLLGFQPEEPDPRVAESAACTPPVPVSSLACFPSQFLLGDTKHYDSTAEVQDVTTQLRGVTPTQFGQMVCSIRHGLTKHAISDLVLLIKHAHFFKGGELIN